MKTLLKYSPVVQIKKKSGKRFSHSTVAGMAKGLDGGPCNPSNQLYNDVSWFWLASVDFGLILLFFGRRRVQTR